MTKFSPPRSQAVGHRLNRFPAVFGNRFRKGERLGFECFHPKMPERARIGASEDPNIHA
jgi:hypothetical protein